MQCAGSHDRCKNANKTQGPYDVASDDPNEAIFRGVLYYDVDYACLDGAVTSESMAHMSRLYINIRQSIH